MNKFLPVLIILISLNLFGAQRIVVVEEYTSGT